MLQRRIIAMLAAAALAMLASVVTAQDADPEQLRTEQLRTEQLRTEQLRTEQLRTEQRRSEQLAEEALQQAQSEAELVQREAELVEEQRRLEALARELARGEAAELERDRARQRALEEQRLARQREMTVELEALRAQVEEARRELEAAARNVATQRLTANQAVYRSLLPTDPAGIGVIVSDSPRGVLVTRVTPGSGAAAAGIEAGDIVRSVNGVTLSGVTEPSAEFVSRVGSANPGDRVAIVVNREGRELPLNVRVERIDAFSGPNALFVRQLNEGPAIVRADNPQSVLWTFGLASRLWSDMELVALTEDLGRYFSTSEGLLVIRAPSDDDLDILDGDVILTISGRPPSTPEHAMRILASFEPGETIELAIMRSGAPQTVTYVLPPADNSWDNR
jgi:hypothetical protein